MRSCPGTINNPLEFGTTYNSLKNSFTALGMDGDEFSLQQDDIEKLYDYHKENILSNNPGLNMVIQGVVIILSYKAATWEGTSKTYEGTSKN